MVDLKPDLPGMSNDHLRWWLNTDPDSEWIEDEINRVEAFLPLVTSATALKLWKERLEMLKETLER